MVDTSSGLSIKWAGRRSTRDLVGFIKESAGGLRLSAMQDRSLSLPPLLLVPI